MKKVIFSVLLSILIIIYSTQLVYAEYFDSNTWVKDSFADARSFMEEPPQDDLKIGKPILNFFKSLIRIVNIVFIIALAAISAISLSITGVRYIAAAAIPAQRNIARQNLQRVFVAMCYGFGAFMIWRISMGIVELVLSSF